MDAETEVRLLRQLLAIRAEVDKAIAGLRPRRHSEDYASVLWDGVDYTFTASQARVVRALWEAADNGTPAMRQETLLEAASSDTGRLSDLFGDHPAWGTMIVSGKAKGTFTLAPDPRAGP